jgi:hypothetical protein
MKCGEILGGMPYGDTVNPYDAVKNDSKTSQVNKYKEHISLAKE